jgi:peptidyl-prolyl cis-trans isomerase A (cyclophilin A)
MSCSQSRQFCGATWLFALLLALAAGCGGSDDAASAPDEQSPSAPSSQNEGDDVPVPGEPPVASPPSDVLPRVEFVTTAGTFTVTLRSDLVPATVQNFLTYVEQPFYDGTIFHDVTPDYAVLGGNYYMDAENIVERTPLPPIDSEAAHGLPNQRGTIAMARAAKDADSADCQFFFNLGDNSDLDYVSEEPDVPVWQTAGYCAFGVVEGNGLEVLDKIARVPVTSRNEMDRVPVTPIEIISVRKL